MVFGVFIFAAARACFFPPLQKVVGFLTASRDVCCEGKLSLA